MSPPAAIHTGTPVTPLIDGVWLEKTPGVDAGVIVHSKTAAPIIFAAARLGFKASPKRHANGIYTIYFTRMKAPKAEAILLEWGAKLAANDDSEVQP